MFFHAVYHVIKVITHQNFIEFCPNTIGAFSKITEKIRTFMDLGNNVFFYYFKSHSLEVSNSQISLQSKLKLK